MPDVFLHDGTGYRPLRHAHHYPRVTHIAYYTLPEAGTAEPALALHYQPESVRTQVIMRWILPFRRTDRGPAMDAAYRWLQANHHNVGYETLSVDTIRPARRRPLAAAARYSQPTGPRDAGAGRRLDRRPPRRVYLFRLVTTFPGYVDRQKENQKTRMSTAVTPDGWTPEAHRGHGARVRVVTSPQDRWNRDTLETLLRQMHEWRRERFDMEEADSDAEVDLLESDGGASVTTL